MKPLIRRAALVGTTSFLTLGLAVPALACSVDGPVAGVRPPAAEGVDPDAPATPTLAEVQARLDAKLAHWLARIDARRTAIEADDSLDPELKAAALAKLQAWEDTVVALRAQIAAETSVEAIRADLKAAHLGGLERWRHHHKHHARHGGHHEGDRAKGNGPGHWSSATGGASWFSWGGSATHGHRDGHAGGHEDGRGHGR